MGVLHNKRISHPENVFGQANNQGWVKIYGELGGEQADSFTWDVNTGGE